MFESIDVKRSILELKIKREGLMGNKYPFGAISIILIALFASMLKNRFEPLLIAALIFAIILIVLSSIVIYNQDTLVRFPINSSPKDIKKLLSKDISSKGWVIYQSDKDILLAGKDTLGLGTQAIILFDANAVYVNVQNIDFNKLYIPFSFGRNKRIREDLLKLIEKIDNDI